MKQSIIVAHNANNVIGKDGEMPWYSKGDMQWFKKHTLNKPVIMGRKTWDSIPKKFRPLPDRKNIVVSSTMKPVDESYYVVKSLEEATKLAVKLIDDLSMELHEEVMYIGGQSIYEQALKFCDTIYITEVKNDSDGDTYLPEIDFSNFKCTFEDAEDKLQTFRIYEKVTAVNGKVVNTIDDQITTTIGKAA